MRLAALQVLQPPAGYVPIRTPSRKLLTTPTPLGVDTGTPSGFRIQTPDHKTHVVDLQPKNNLPMLKPDDLQYFDKLLVGNSVARAAARRRAPRPRPTPCARLARPMLGQ